MFIVFCPAGVLCLQKQHQPRVSQAAADEHSARGTVPHSGTLRAPPHHFSRVSSLIRPPRLPKQSP